MAPTCGPVVAAAVIMPPNARKIAGVRDSKTLSLAQRERLEPLIRARAVAVGVGAASVAEIDRLNIYHATHLAMRRAIARLGGHDHVLVDGNRIVGFEAHVGPYTSIVDGDATCYSDRLRLDRGQGRPRPADDAPGGALSRATAGSTTPATPRPTIARRSRRSARPPSTDAASRRSRPPSTVPSSASASTTRRRPTARAPTWPGSRSWWTSIPPPPMRSRSWCATTSPAGVAGAESGP